MLDIGPSTIGLATNYLKGVASGPTARLQMASPHPNIRSIDSMSDAALAGAIAEACGLWGEPVDASCNPAYTRAEHFGFMADLAAGLLTEIGA